MAQHDQLWLLVILLDKYLFKYFYFYINTYSTENSITELEA